MKLVKKLFAVAMMTAVAGFVFADEWDDFGDDSSAAAEPSVTIGGSAEFAGRAYTDQRKDGDSGDFYAIENTKTEAKYTGRLNFDYTGASSDVSFKLKLDNNSLGEYKEDILDELQARAYLGNFQIEAGKMKTVWGKGDKLHVVDNFNANDYTDFIYPDYLDRRIGEPMMRLVYSNPSNVKFEAIYTPKMTVDRLASGGIWQPAKSKALTSLVEEAVGYNLALDVAGATSNPGLPSSIGAVSSIMEASSFSSDNLVADDINSIKYGQAGARTTFTLAGIDLGLSYYYGHNKQPSANLSPYINSISKAVNEYAGTTDGQTEIQSIYGTEITATATAIGTMYQQAVIAAAAAGQAYKAYDNVTKEEVILTDATTIATVAGHNAFAKTCADHAEEIFVMTGKKFELPSLAYDRVQVFGLEAATVIWKFNIRGEAAYYLTEDTAGDNPWVQNNSIQWVAGFDMDWPLQYNCFAWLSNVNFNVQTQGKYIMNSDKIKAAGATDVNYNSDDKYCTNKVVLDITDSHFNDSVKIDIKGIYEIETKDFVVMPSLSVKAVDDFTVTASGMWIKTDNENSEFYNFRRNSFAQISCKYLF